MIKEWEQDALNLRDSYSSHFYNKSTVSEWRKHSIIDSLF